MLDRHVSAPFVGRSSELDVMRAAWEASRTQRAGAVVVTGEAGAGKSALVRAFVESLPADQVVLQGSCVAQDTGTLPYGPFVATLRRLRRGLGHEQLEALIGASLVARLETVVPSNGGAVEALPADLARSRLFEAYLATLEALAERSPVVVVLEDLHWIDAPSCDLLRFLLSSLDSPGILLVLTKRPEDSSQTSPLSDLARFPGVSQLDLAGLDEVGVREQLTSLLQAQPESELVARVFARTAGVPLYVEALVGPDGSVLPGVPGSLRDLLLRPLNWLPAESQQVVKVASLAGHRISHQLLSAVSGLEAADLEERLRPALDAQLLIADEFSYRFRHDLIAQAVREHLLPGERMAIHRRFAEAIDAGAGTDVEDEDAEAPAVHRRMRVARHWRGAFDHAETLRSAIAAARLASEAGRPTEELDMLELALQVWDRVADAEAGAGTTRIRLLEEAAKASCWAARPERGTLLAAAALELLDADREPDRSAAVLLESASSKHLLLSDAWAELERASALPMTDPAMRLAVFGMLTRTAVDDGDNDRARASLEAMRATLASTGLLGVALADYELTRLRVRLIEEDAEHVLPALRECHRRARAADHRELEAMAALTLARALAWSGRSSEAATFGQAALVRASTGGVQHFHGARLVFETAATLVAVGRWKQALQVIDRSARSESAPHHVAHVQAIRAEVALRQDELDDAIEHLDRLRELLESGGDAVALRLTSCRLQAEYAQAVGDFDKVVALAHELLATPGPSHLRWPALAAVAGALAAEGSGIAAGRDEAVTAVSEASAGVPTLGRLDSAHRSALLAYVRRAHAAAEPAEWLGLAEVWARLERPYDRGVALLRASQCVATADRRRATALLGEAAATADELGAAALVKQCEALARRIGAEPRLTRTAPGAQTLTGLQLTDRETEVLRLVAKGMSNVEIAGELFITRKTASVHVSNILGKLQVPNRGGAAAFAHRHHLFDLT